MVGLALVAFVVRLIVIHRHPDGGYDLKVYMYFGARAMHGVNPNTAAAHGPVPGVHGDEQLFEFLLFGGLLRLHDSQDALRIFFAFPESATLVLVGFGFRTRSEIWRPAVMTLFAFEPHRSGASPRSPAPELQPREHVRGLSPRLGLVWRPAASFDARRAKVAAHVCTAKTVPADELDHLQTDDERLINCPSAIRAHSRS